MAEKENKAALARALGISRSLLYYTHTKPKKDWRLKQQIEDVLHEHPSYGHRRIATELHINKKRVRRVMRLYGMKPYRTEKGRKGRKGVTESRKGVRSICLIKNVV